jgi:hypothetical protein
MFVAESQAEFTVGNLIQFLVGDGFSKSPAKSSPGVLSGIAYPSLAHNPKSISLQRSLQNGRKGLARLNSASFLQFGQATLRLLILHIERSGQINELKGKRIKGYTALEKILHPHRTFGVFAYSPTN